MVIKHLRRFLPGRVRPLPTPGERARRRLPPLPARLQEQLKDYPEHRERLQLALYGVVVSPPSRLPRLERALWVLEDRVGRFLAEARQELDAARCSGDAVRLARAKETEQVMYVLRMRHQWLRDEVFVAYFKAVP